MIALRFWREILIVAAVITLFAMWKAREKALVESGRNLERARVADSALSVLRPALARVDTVLTTRLRTITHTIARTDTLRDSLLIHLRDTLRLVEYIRQTDTLRAECAALAGSCLAFRDTARLTIAALEARFAVPPVQRSCTPGNVVSGLLGVAGGFVIGRR